MAPNHDIAHALGHADIDGINEREGERHDDVKQREPFAGLATRCDRSLRDDVSFDDSERGVPAAPDTFGISSFW